MISPSILQQPQLLHKRYSIQQTIGARLGRRTLLGYDHSHNRQVVIKYLCFDDPLQPADIQRFHKEVAVLKTLNHPFISAYLDDFEINTPEYRGLMLVQTYTEGQSLYALIQNQRPFTEPELRRLARQILEILDYLHSQQPAIIHRDIKPSSLVLSHDFSSTTGQVHLVDFGLVQRADHPAMSRDTPLRDTPILISGTPGYRPPEQLGDRAVPATDLYSLGATLVHLATGKHPSTLPQRGLQMLFGQELGHMGRPIKTWLRWLTQPRQYKRPQSVRAALHGLEQTENFLLSPYNRLSLASLSRSYQRALLETMASAHSQLKILEYSQTLEIQLPPLGWKHRRFGLALLQTILVIVSTGFIFHSLQHLWPQLLGFWQRSLAVGIGLGWLNLGLRWGYGSVKAMMISLFQQTSLQLLPDVLLLGHRFPHRPVEYQVNVCRHDIEDIVLPSGSSTIMLYLHRNRTLVGELKHSLTAKTLGITRSEIHWINTILQLWLKQGTYGEVG